MYTVYQVLFVSSAVAVSSVFFEILFVTVIVIQFNISEFHILVMKDF